MLFRSRRLSFDLEILHAFDLTLRIQFPGGENVTVPDTLRFMDRAELAGFLTAARLTDITWYGDWDRSPVSPASPEIIAVAGVH